MKLHTLKNIKLYIQITSSFLKMYTLLIEYCLTLLILIVTVKINFSKLKLIKSYLKSIFLDKLNGLAMLSIEYEILEHLIIKL